MMDREHLERVESLYQAVVDLPNEERDAFLTDSCGHDIGLRNDLESLLHYDSPDPVFLDSPPASLAAEIFSNDETDPLLAIGQIGRYKLERLLGEGGMGKVYLAEDMRLHRRVAIKVLPNRFVADADRVRRFEREAQAASALNHPNILTVHEFAEDDGLYYIASEFVDGRTLRQRLAGDGPLPIDVTIDIAIQIASALTAAHEAGITHRDIKPENVMIRPDGYVKVLDFGLAKHGKGFASNIGSGSEDPTRALLDTAPGLVMGTEAYMSPEQVRGLKIDARTDIWSLGVVIYEMLTGRRPFSADNRADTIVSLLSHDPPPIAESLRCPDELEKAVRKALSKDAGERHQSANELRAELVAINRSNSSPRERTASPEQRSSQAETGSELHSTVETGFPTQPDAEEGTEDSGGRYRLVASHPRAPSSSGLLGMLRGWRLRSAIVAAILLVLISIGVYLALFAKGGRAIDSVAVLPFEDLTGSPELASFSGSIADVVTDQLSQLPQLRVVSRSSTSRFKPGEYDILSAADRLGVRAIVTGKITRSGDDIFVRMEIVDAVENHHLAGMTFRRPLSAISSMQSEIAHAAAKQLQLKLTDQQQQRLSSYETENPEAYGYYLSGLVELNGPQDVRSRALEYFQRAVEVDPEFSAAHAEIAWIYASRANGSDNPHELMPPARSAAERALDLNAENAKAHVVMAMMHEYAYDWKAAETAYQRAINAAPNLDFPRNNYAFFLSAMGRQDEALAHIEEQSVRDPLNRRMALLYKGIVLVQARRFDDALEAYQQAQSIDPGRDIPNFALAYAYAGKGEYDVAAEYYRKSIDQLGGDGKYSQPLVYLAATYAKIPSKRDDARGLLARIEAMQGYRSPVVLAAAYAALGDIDRAMYQLEDAFVRRDPLLRYVGVGYEYDELRADPRFTDLIKRVGLVGQTN